MVDEDHFLLQKALQGWRAVVQHMAGRRELLQLAALASAERAVKRGCHAATGRLASWGDNSQAEDRAKPMQPALDLFQPTRVTQHGHQHDLERVGMQLLPSSSRGSPCIQQPAQVPSECSHGRHDQQATTVPGGSGCLQETHNRVHMAQATLHHTADLLAKSFRSWQELTKEAVMQLFQQHELKAMTSQQLLQVVPPFCACLHH